MAIVHNLVASTAKGIAGAFYEDAARDNFFFSQNRSQRTFIRKNWKNFVRAARETLTTMLTMRSVPQHSKDQIFEALQLDKAVNAPRSHVQQAIADGTLVAPAKTNFAHS